MLVFAIFEILISPLSQQDSVVQGPLTKHSNHEQVLMMHAFKTKFTKYQQFFDKAFQHLQAGVDEKISEVERERNILEVPAFSLGVTLVFTLL